MTSPVIQVSGCRKVYGSTVAMADVSFEVCDGEIFGLIGPNGAGKTTTLECIEGLRRPDRGTIAVLGMDPLRDVYRLQERVGVQLQEAQLQKRIKVLIAISAVLSLVTIVSIYREGGILKRLRATPLRPQIILSAHVVVKLLLTAVTLALMMLAGKRYYPLPIGHRFSASPRRCCSARRASCRSAS
ncbi:MAG: ATP-binding cassette domain-containing protein [Vicinamibacterales bacterium]